MNDKVNDMEKIEAYWVHQQKIEEAIALLKVALKYAAKGDGASYSDLMEIKKVLEPEDEKKTVRIRFNP